MTEQKNKNIINNSIHINSASEPKPNSVGDIKCTSLNVCGLKIRVEYPDFTNLLQHYDMFLCLK